MCRISVFIFSIAWLIAAVATPAYGGATLNKIKSSGSLPCGINTVEPEYSTQDAHGNHSLLDLDICKAVAVAVLGSNAKFTITPFRDEQAALKALKAVAVEYFAECQERRTG